MGFEPVPPPLVSGMQATGLFLHRFIYGHYRASVLVLSSDFSMESLGWASGPLPTLPTV